MGVELTANDLRILQDMQRRDAADPRVSYDQEDDSPTSYTPADLWVQLTNTTITANISSTGSQTVTAADMTGIFVGAVLAMGGTAENVTVTAITSTTFTATYAHTHTSGATVKAAINGAGRWPGVLYSRDGYTPGTTEQSPVWVQSINATVPPFSVFFRVTVTGYDDVTGNTICDLVEGVANGVSPAASGCPKGFTQITVVTGLGTLAFDPSTCGFTGALATTSVCVVTPG